LVKFDHGTFNFTMVYMQVYVFFLLFSSRSLFAEHVAFTVRTELKEQS